MQIIYATRTGNTRRFLKHSGFIATPIEEIDHVSEEFILVTYTDGRGIIPPGVDRFLEKNSEYLRAVASSGSLNFGEDFARAADIISHRYDVPILHKFELSGKPSDVATFIRRVNELEKSH